MPTASMNFTNIFIHFHWKVGGIIQMETSCKRTIAPTPAWQRQVFVRQSIILWTSTEVKQHHNFFFVITLWQPTCSPLQSPCSELHSAANGPSIPVNNAKVWNTFLCHSKLLDALRLRSILAVPPTNYLHGRNLAGISVIRQPLNLVMHVDRLTAPQ